MYLVVIAWLYVTIMMSVAEATSSTGSVLGAIVTFVLYGLLPLSIVVYIMGTPARKRAIHARAMAERAEAEAAAAAAAALPEPSSPSAQPDAGSHAPAGAQGGAVTPVRKEP